MKKIDKHIYVNIFECEDNLHKFTYRVELKTVYDILIFGKIRHISINKTLPFYFLTLERAKDYCSIMPSYKKVTLTSKCDFDNAGYTIYETYKTYQLELNDGKIFYIMWRYENRNVEYGGMIANKTIHIKPANDYTIDKFGCKHNFLYQNNNNKVQYYDLLSDAIDHYEENEEHFNKQSKNKEKCYTFELIKK